MAFLAALEEISLPTVTEIHLVLIPQVGKRIFIPSILPCCVFPYSHPSLIKFSLYHYFCILLSHILLWLSSSQLLYHYHTYTISSSYLSWDCTSPLSPVICCFSPIYPDLSLSPTLPPLTLKAEWIGMPVHKYMPVIYPYIFRFAAPAIVALLADVLDILLMMHPWI